MTFERFYSIIMPHKAASFNTIKRAKITIVCIIILCSVQNIPFGFIASFYNWQCQPFGRDTGNTYILVYYWSSFVLSFMLPFILLLSMNSVIIHKIRTRSILGGNLNTNDKQRTIQKQGASVKNSNGQVFAVLLLVTFAFLILVTPTYCCQLYTILVNIVETPKIYAEYYLFYSAAQKIYFTNHGINFFLYVLSGRKFRQDLIKLFWKDKLTRQSSVNLATDNSSIRC